MPRYFTTYRDAKLNGRHSWVYAENGDEASEMCRLRGLGERLSCEAGPIVAHFDRPISQVLRDNSMEPAERLHALIFFCGLASKSVGLDGSQPGGWGNIFDDSTGVLHQWAHLETGRVEGKPANVRRMVLRKVERMEKLIPGYRDASVRRRAR